ADLGQRFAAALGEKPHAGSTASSVAVSTAPKTAPASEIQRPGRGTLPATSRPTPATMQGDYTKQDINEVLFDLKAPMPAAAAITKVAGFLEKLGARIVERGNDSLRAMLGVDCHASRSAPPTSTSSSSMHLRLVLTELEAQVIPRGSERQISLTFRPMG